MSPSACDLPAGMSNSTAREDGWTSSEFGGVRLGDRRLDARLRQVIAALAAEPTASFPKAFASEAALEAGYRFFANDGISAGDILAPHLESTALRCERSRAALVIHDTTEFMFNGETRREGLGRLRSSGQGFFAHFALAFSDDGLARPLGTLSLEAIVRPPHRKGGRSAGKRRKDPTNEGRRWARAVENSERLLADGCKAVHVMDREGDSYELLIDLVQAKRDFVIRAAHDRVIEELEGARRLSEALPTAPALFERMVPLSSRKSEATSKSRRIHPGRDTRLAKLSFRTRAVTVLRPGSVLVEQRPSVELNVVHVTEVDTPAAASAIEWKLLTTLPVSTAEQVARVVDIYRARWRIEEFFKALKTGCIFEKRQLESFHGLLNALAVFTPIAWRLLLLRSTARSDDLDKPATTVMPQSRVRALVTLANSRGSKLSDTPTVREALLGVARIGGHIKNNGEPGWLVLGRGYEDLLIFEAGWLAAQAAGNVINR
jgi:hypothetical protein